MRPFGAQIPQKGGGRGQLQHFRGPFGDRGSDSPGHCTWCRDHLTPGHTERDVSLGQKCRIAHSIEFELISIDAMSAPPVALDDHPAADDPEVDLVSADGRMERRLRETERAEDL